MVLQPWVVAQHGVAVAGCCVAWCCGCGRRTMRGVAVMAIVPYGVVVVVGIVMPRDAAVTVIALRGATVAITLSCMTLALARTLKASSLATAHAVPRSLHPPAYPTQTQMHTDWPCTMDGVHAAEPGEHPRLPLLLPCEHLKVQLLMLWLLCLVHALFCHKTLLLFLLYHHCGRRSWWLGCGRP